MDAADLMFAGIARQAELVRGSEVSSRELVQVALNRIAQLDPALNAFRVVLAEEALAAADAADARRARGESALLLGVPVAVKDDNAVAGQKRMMGTDAVETPQRADGEAVARLRRAGAVVVGLTHLPELGILPVTESPSYGATRNPWDVHRTPGGSSGGTAAAVASGMVGAGLGSDGGGSIRIPAASCGLVGLKSEPGRVPTAPFVEPWQGLSVFGPIARRTADLGLFFDAIKDGAESWQQAAAADPGPLTVAVSLGVPKPIAARPDAEQRDAVEQMAQTLRGLGHTVVEREIDYGTAALRFTSRMLRGIHDTAGQLVERPERLSRRTHGYIRLGAAVRPSVVAQARAGAEADARRTDEFFAAGVDAVLTPMFTRRPVPVHEWEGRGATWTLNANGRYVPYCAYFNHTGHPAIAVPAGWTPDRFPLAVQFAAPRGAETRLLSLAGQIERALDWPAERPPVS